VIASADQAKRLGIDAISVYAFGVAGGIRLMALARSVVSVERETGVRARSLEFFNLHRFAGEH
jgi:NCAIR mutase (PurE)-related protein